MDSLRIALQVVAGLGLLNVWILRFGIATAYRGGNATNMPEEFAAYGLPMRLMWLVGALKLGIASSLLAGIWIPILVRPAAGLLVVLMLGAVVMHLKVRDPLRKSLPATAMLLIAVTLLLI